MAHTLCMLDEQGYMHVRACTRPRAQETTRTHAIARQTKMYYSFSTATTIRERSQCYVITWGNVKRYWEELFIVIAVHSLTQMKLCMVECFATQNYWILNKLHNVKRLCPLNVIKRCYTSCSIWSLQVYTNTVYHISTQAPVCGLVSQH
jgi:hypothetical protein